MLNMLRLQFVYSKSSFKLGDIPGALTGHSAGFLIAAIVASGITTKSEMS